MSHITTVEVKILEVVDLEPGAMGVAAINASWSDTCAMVAESGEVVVVVSMAVVSFQESISELTEHKATTGGRGTHTAVLLK